MGDAAHVGRRETYRPPFFMMNPWPLPPHVAFATALQDVGVDTTPFTAERLDWGERSRLAFARAGGSKDF